MGRSFFSMGFRSDPFMGTPPGMAALVGAPVMLDLTYEQIKAQGWTPLRNVRSPKGFTIIYPFVVKLTNGTGEFMVYSDGTTQWTKYGSGNVSAPFRIK